MLSEYYLAIEDLQECVRACAKELSQWDGIDYIQLHRMGDLAQDIFSFSENMARAHINATMWSVDSANEARQNTPSNPPNWEDLHAFISGERELESHIEDTVKEYIEVGRKSVERMVRRSNSRAGKHTEESTWELKACYKAYFFFIRAFHDACYGVLLNLNGLTPGAYSSMNKCISKNVSPMYEQVCTIPGYVEWFKSFKEKRDLIKRGVNFSLCGPQWDVGIGFVRVTPGNGIVIDVGESGNKFRLSDLVSAIKYSIALIQTISEVSNNSNKSLSLTGTENAQAS